jgi:hypothetical protein
MDHEAYLLSNTKLFVTMQAMVRGKKVREQWKKRREFLHAHMADIINCQRILRGVSGCCC